MILFLKKASVFLLGIFTATGVVFINSDPYQTTKGLPRVPFNKQFNYDKTAINPIIRLHDEAGDFFCTAIVFDIHHAATAAHCATDMLGLIKKKDIKAFSNRGKFITDVKVEVVNQFTDTSILRGDFSKVQSVEADFTGETALSPNAPLVTCGYPTGQKEIYCVTTAFAGNLEFGFLAFGMPIYKGMSGGPVFYNGKLIAVNSAVAERGLIFGPLIGLKALLEYAD